MVATFQLISMTMTTVAIQMTPSPMIVDAVDDERLELVHVPHRPAHQVAGALPLEVAEALALELVVDAVAEREDEPLGDAVHQVGADRAERLADRVDDEEPAEGGDQELKRPGEPAVKAEEVRQDRRRVGLAGEDQVVGDVLPDQGREQLARRPTDQQQDTEREQPVVRPQQPQQPAKHLPGGLDGRVRLVCKRLGRGGGHSPHFRGLPAFGRHVFQPPLAFRTTWVKCF